MKKKLNKNTEPQKWELLGFTDKHHYQGFLYFNGLVEEVYTYDNVWYDEYSGNIITIGDDEVDSEAADEEYVKEIMQGKLIDSAE